MKLKYEYYFESLLDNMIEGVAIHELIFDENKNPINYIILDINKSYEEIMGLKKENIINKKSDEVYGYPAALDVFSEVVITKKAIKTIIEYDGRYFETSISPWNEVGFITIFSDITDSIELENTLKDSYLFTENLLSTANVMIVGLDLHGRVNIFNKMAEEITGYNKMEVLGKNWFTELDILIKDDVPTVKNVFETLLSDDETGNRNENPIVTKHGEVRYILWQNNEVRKNDKISGTISYGLDITDMKMGQYELIKAKERAEQSEKLKMAFLANMSHDLRTPINSIIGFSELLKDNGLTKNQKIEYLDIIIKNGDILTNLINDIIDITKIDSGTLLVQKTEIELNKLLQLLKVQFDKMLKNNKVKFFIDIDLNSNIFVLSDKFRIKQILMNLLSNAFKFTKKGSIKFGYKILNDNYLKIYVQDTGCGISENDLPVIFNRFSQLGHPGSKEKGAGLGLPISKSLVNILGFGDLKVESKIDKGSIFYFKVPYIIKDVYKLKDNDDIQTDINLEDINVLIVEDNQNFRTVVKSYLSDTKCKVFVSNGENVIDLIKKKDIKLVLLDLGLGEIDGYNILKDIKSYDKKIKVIVQSAYAMVEFRKKAFDMGADDFLSKPVSKTILLNSINKLF